MAITRTSAHDVGPLSRSIAPARAAVTGMSREAFRQEEGFVIRGKCRQRNPSSAGFAATRRHCTILVAGITPLIDRPFRIGDWVRMGDLEGRVERIMLRTTRIRTRRRHLVRVVGHPAVLRAT